MQSSGCPVKLYCFPYAGGSTGIFRAWQSLFPANIRIEGVELPGHGKRLAEVPMEDLNSLVRLLATELAGDLEREARLSPGLRFAVFGHSAGAALALSVAAEIEHILNVAPVRCFLCAAPHFKAPKRQRSHLSDTALVEELRLLGGTPAQILDEPDLLALVLPALRADFRMHEQSISRCDLRVTYPFTLLAALKDEIRMEDVWGWRDYTSGPCRQIVLQGDHFFPMREPLELISHIRADLEHALCGRSDIQAQQSPGALQ